MWAIWRMELIKQIIQIHARKLGWCYRFMKHHGLSIGAKPSQKMPQEYEAKIQQKYYLSIALIIVKCKTMPKPTEIPPGAVHVHDKGWTDETGMIIWINRVWERRKDALLKKTSSCTQSV